MEERHRRAIKNTINIMYWRTKGDNKLLHVSYAAVGNFSICFPHNGLLPNYGLLPAVRERHSHVNGGVRLLPCHMRFFGCCCFLEAQSMNATHVSGGRCLSVRLERVVELHYAVCKAQGQAEDVMDVSQASGSVVLRPTFCDILRNTEQNNEHNVCKNTVTGPS